MSDATDPLLRWFEYGHLPLDLKEISGLFGDLATDIVDALPRTAERSVALRKLLEAKDAAVRCAIEARELITE